MKQEIKLFSDVITTVLEQHRFKNNCMKAFHSVESLKEILADFVTVDTL